MSIKPITTSLLLQRNQMRPVSRHTSWRLLCILAPYLILAPTLSTADKGEEWNLDYSIRVGCNRTGKVLCLPQASFAQELGPLTACCVPISGCNLEPYHRCSVSFLLPRPHFRDLLTFSRYHLFLGLCSYPVLVGLSLVIILILHRGYDQGSVERPGRLRVKIELRDHN